MKLHRYFSSHADTTLSEGRLRLTHASSLNDPFEFFHRNTGCYGVTQMEAFLRTPKGKEYIAAAWEKVEQAGQAGVWAAQLFSDPVALAHYFIRSNPSFPDPDTMGCHQLADEYLRICCFTDPNKVEPMAEILLWSHYAAKHAGARIEFDFDPEITSSRFQLIGVVYDKQRVAIDYPGVVFGDQTQMQTQEVIRTKAEVWSYEAEVRLVCSAAGITSQDRIPGVEYVKFERSWVSGVDLGINFPQEDVSRVQKILSDNYPENVVLRQAVRHPSNFAIHYTPV